MGVGIVSSNGVNDVDFVLEECLGSYLEWGFAFGDKASFDAVFDVGQLCN